MGAFLFLIFSQGLATPFADGYPASVSTYPQEILPLPQTLARVVAVASCVGGLAAAGGVAGFCAVLVGAAVFSFVDVAVWGALAPNFLWGGAGFVTREWAAVLALQEQAFPPFSGLVLMALLLQVFLEAVFSLVLVLPLVVRSFPLAAPHPADDSSEPHADLPVFQLQRRAGRGCQTCIQVEFMAKSAYFIIYFTE